MASYGWRQGRPVTEALRDEGHRFAFVQAVRLLEQLRPDRTPPGEGTDPRREVVHFRHEVRLDFPPTDVETVVERTTDEPAEMTVNILGLAGALGPLPPAVTELIIERSFRKDHAFRDFLDIFNHRLVSLLYRARKKYRPALATRGQNHGPDKGRVANVLFAFLGLQGAGLQNRMGVRDRSLLAYAGLIVDRSRSQIGLVRVLENYFATKVSIEPLDGRWHVLEPEDTTRIGVHRGQNQLLGQGAILGRRVWNQEASFQVCLGPMPLAQFRSFLKKGAAHDPLVALIRFYVREELGYTIRLEVEGQDIPLLKLEGPQRPQLGWTTWLTTKPVEKNDKQVRLMGREA